MKHSYPSISVSQFFEDMINEGNVRPEADPMTVSDASMPDLREIPDVDLSNLFGAKKAPKKVVAEAKEPSKDLNQEMLELMIEFKQVVQKANKLFSEMTTVGMGIVGMGGMGPKKRREPAKGRQLITHPENAFRSLDFLQGQEPAGGPESPEARDKRKAEEEDRSLSAKKDLAVKNALRRIRASRPQDKKR